MVEKDNLVKSLEKTVLEKNRADSGSKEDVLIWISMAYKVIFRAA